MSNKPLLSLCMIVKADNKEAELLDRCLESIHKHVDEILITITGKNKKCSEVCDKYGAITSYMKWEGDFAKARNFNFAQASGEWILWLDADDIVKKGENIKPLLESEDAVGIDGFVNDYFYHFNEDGDCDARHLKTMIIRNNGCMQWEGNGIHEDLAPMRKINMLKTNCFERLHLPTEEHIDTSKGRNLEISKEWITKNPKDPRSWWNYANSLMGLEKYEESLEPWYTFITLSESDEEKFIAWDRLAQSYSLLGQQQKAIDCELISLSIRPWYPDAWIGLGHLYFLRKEYKHAKFFLLQGLQLKPPTDEIVVYNPRQYDFVPLQLLAKVYYLLGDPYNALDCIKVARKSFPNNQNLVKIEEDIEKEVKELRQLDELLKDADKLETKEEIKALLDSIPEELQGHPKVVHLRNVHFIKTETTGKEVTIFCGETAESWTPDSIKTGIGGSEEAVIHLSQRWANAGYDVTVYASCGHKPFVRDGVSWKPYWMWNYRDKHDTLIFWRHPLYVDFNVDAKQILIDLHDVVPEVEFTPERMEKIDKLMVKSQAHRELFPKVPDDKFVIVPNGIDPSVFELGERDNHKIIFTSSPDRGLKTALEMFREIKKEVPEAQFYWYYGWGNYDVWHKGDKEKMDYKREVQDLFNEIEGAHEMGRIGHYEIAKEYSTANIFFYPTAFYEIHCISAAKAQAGGSVPIVTNFAALDETVQHGYKNESEDIYHDPINQKKMIKEAVAVLRGKKKYDREKMSTWAKERFDWNSVAQTWIETFKV